jgi:RND family efflux transporter MFP subunit
LKTRNILLPLVLTVFFIFSACSEPVHEELKRREISGVTVNEVMLESVPLSYEVNGSIKAETVSTISSRVMGDIKKVHVNVGQRIKKGQLLVSIDDRAVAQKVSAAEEVYEETLRMLHSARERSMLADKTYNRLKELYDKAALSEQEFDSASTERNVRQNELKRATAMLARAEAGLKEARLYVGYTKVTAPIDSVVIKKHVSQGALASPGLPLVTIEDPSAFKLEVNVDARYQNLIEPGMDVEVNFEALGETCTATVARVIPSIDPATRSFPVEIKSGGKRPDGMRTGLYAKVTFTVGAKDAILVPAVSVVKKGQLEGVYLVTDDGVVVYRLIRSGEAYKDKVTVLSGLRAGDRIITEGISAAIDGGIIKE